MTVLMPLRTIFPLQVPTLVSPSLQSYQLKCNVVAKMFAFCLPETELHCVCAISFGLDILLPQPLYYIGLEVSANPCSFILSFSFILMAICRKLIYMVLADIAHLVKAVSSCSVDCDNEHDTLKICRMG